MFTELLRRLEGPAELLGIALRTILQYGAGTKSSTVFYNRDTTSWIGKNTGNSRLCSNDTCQQKQWKQQKRGFPITASVT